MFRSFSLTAIMAVGMMLVIITGGIDLSVGSVTGLSSPKTALAFQHGAGALAAIAAGAFNGVLITRIQRPPFIATLGTLSTGSSLMYTITKGVPLTPDVPTVSLSLARLPRLHSVSGRRDCRARRLLPGGDAPHAFRPACVCDGRQ